jgi:Ala-tRNA(Pro) deacylase
MPLPEQIRSYLDSHETAYSVTTHPNAFTARQVALAEHLPPRTIAKTVVVFGDGEYHMLVVPASRLVDLQEARPVLGLTHLRLATEEELAQLFPDCEVGAMPPFGPLYGFPVYLDGTLAAEETIAFNAGNHREVIHMKTVDFRRLIKPLVVSIVREAVGFYGA